MTPDITKPYLVAVVGAGPAGIYAARMLAAEGAEVVLLNRDIKPGGLAEYGIFYNKCKMKDGLRKQFRQILSAPDITYYGNITVGQNSDLTLDELQQLGFQAILVTAGAQGTKWLGLPGERFRGVYHAKDLVYHYNQLPPYSTQEYDVHGRVALIGVGNVMLDIAHWLVRDIKVDEVIAVARRGPAEVKFSKKELEYVSANLDLLALEAEIARCSPIMRAVGQDVQAAKDYILSGLPKAWPAVSKTRFRFDFLASPTRLYGDASGHVYGLEVEDNTLLPKNGDTRPRGLGTCRLLNVNTVVFCISDKVDETFGLPVQWNEYIKNPSPRFPIEGLSYEAYNPQTGQPIEGVFVAGWSREAGNGLVGLARKDGENGARATLEYLKTLPPLADHQPALDGLKALLERCGKRTVLKDDVTKLDIYEQAEAARRGVEEYKLKTNDEMLAVIQ